MIEIRNVEMCDKAFWYSLDRHLPDEEFEKKVKDKMGYVLLEDDKYIGLLRYNLLIGNVKIKVMGKSLWNIGKVI